MKKMRSTALSLLLAGLTVYGVAAAGTTQITVEQRPDVTVIVGGEKQTMRDKNGKAVYPLAYQGTTYLPIRALGEALGHDVVWDSSTQTITLTSKGMGYENEATLDALEKNIAAEEKEIGALVSGESYTQRARQYAQHSGVLDDLKDNLALLESAARADYDGGKLTYTAYAAQQERADALAQRIRDARAQLEKKTIAQDSGYQTALQRDEAALKEMETRAADLEKQVNSLKAADTYAGRSEQYAQKSEAIATARRDLAGVMEQINDDLRQRRITTAEYNALQPRMDKADVRLKDALVKLQDILFGAADNAERAAEIELAALESRMDTLEGKIDQLKPASTAAARRAQYNELDKEWTGLDLDLEALEDTINSDLRQGRLTYTQYDRLDDRADRVGDRLKAARKAMEKKTVAGDSETAKPQSDAYDTYTATLDALEKRVQQEVKALENYNPGHGEPNNKQQYRQMMRKLEALEDEIDQAEDQVESAYHKGGLTAAQYKTLDRRLDQMEDTLDRLDDRLENILDDDHDDWDDDDDEDWDD